MNWQTRDKDLTREEVIALAQKNVAPYWLNSLPLFMADQADSGLGIFPLDEQVIKKTWVLLFVDLSTFGGESILAYAAELDRRYRAYQVGVLIIIHAPYLFSKVKRHIHHWGRTHAVSMPCAFDFDDSLRAAFGVRSESQALIFDQGKRVFESSEGLELPVLEKFLQNFLRQKDPGLALFPVLQPFAGVPVDSKRFEFGFTQSFGENAQFRGVEFKELDPMTRVGMPQESTSPVPGEFLLVGKWHQDWERIWTADPLARIEFESPAPWVSLVAQPLAGEPKDKCFIEVELSSDRVYSDVIGSHLHLSETGEAVLEFSHPGLFQLLKKLPSKDRCINLSFPLADQAPVALYGIRFGELPSV